MKAECGQGRRILIVEDYDDARAMYAAYLSFHGYDVVEAASGNEVQHVVIAHGGRLT